MLRAISSSLELLNSEGHAGVKRSSLSDSFDLKTNKCLLVFFNYDFFLSVVKIILKHFVYLLLSTIVLIHFSLKGKHVNAHFRYTKHFFGTEKFVFLC